MKGINLPKNDSEWSTANDYFKCALQPNDPITLQDLNSKIKLLNDAIYNYFANNYGHTETVLDKNMVAKYKEYTVKELKKALQNLRSKKGDLSEIKYVSRTLRDRLRNKSNDADELNDSEYFNHNKYLERSFWGYVKNTINRKDAVLPSFNMTDCLSYFSKSLAKINPNKLFVIPSWIPKLSDPEVQFNLDPLTYQQITNVIRKMKSSGSPCPLDQLSIISFKHCSFLRTYLTELIHDIWLSGTVPTEWKRACTILIHKKGNNNDPSNFRPITFESIPLKVFTSCLRNAVYSFLASNNFVGHNIQKGFSPNLSGTLEHTAQMADIINKARIRQRSVVITLLDLKNALEKIHEYNTRSSSMKNFYVKYTGSDLQKRFFANTGARVWNVVPMELRENSKHNFRKKMHDELLQMLVMEDEYIDISVILKRNLEKPKTDFRNINQNLRSLTLNYGYRSPLLSKQYAVKHKCFARFDFDTLLTIFQPLSI